MHDQVLSHGPNGATVTQHGHKSANDYFPGPHQKATICSTGAYEIDILKAYNKIHAFDVNWRNLF